MEHLPPEIHWVKKSPETNWVNKSGTGALLVRQKRTGLTNPGGCGAKPHKKMVIAIEWLKVSKEERKTKVPSPGRKFCKMGPKWPPGLLVGTCLDRGEREHSNDGKIKLGGDIYLKICHQEKKNNRTTQIRANKPKEGFLPRGSVRSGINHMQKSEATGRRGVKRIVGSTSETKKG